MALAFDFFEPVRPPLKWAGGKRWLVPHLRPLWRGHEDRRLVEPFVGGLAVVLNLAPRRALLNDMNPHLMSFYRWLQRGLDIGEIDIEMRNDRRIFVRNRIRFNALISEGNADCAEAAALFYYLNRTGFNGLCRFNSSGLFNVPFGSYKTISYRYDFSDYSTVLTSYELRAGDFATLRMRRDDFIYSDPPYDVEFTSYSAGGFSWDDQVRLAKWLAAQRGPVVASNQATPRILKLYRSLGFSVTTLSAPRRISCDGNRDDAREMLAMRNL